MKTNINISTTWHRLAATMLLCYFVTLLPCHAQAGLHINQVFEGKIVPKSQMVETRIRGKAISKYRLSFFHSVRFTCDNETFKRIDHLASQDFVDGTSQFGQTSPQSSGIMHSEGNKKVFTQMYELPRKGATTRYLCYKRRNDLVTVIYLEGSLTSLNELKKILND